MIRGGSEHLMWKPGVLMAVAVMVTTTLFGWHSANAKQTLPFFRSKLAFRQLDERIDKMSQASSLRCSSSEQNPTTLQPPIHNNARQPPRWELPAALRVGLSRVQCRSAEAFRDLSLSCLQRTGYHSRMPLQQASPVPTVWISIAGGSQVRVKMPSSSKKETTSTKSDKKKHTHHHHSSPLSASKPFFSLEALGELTLSEIGKAFEYVVQSTREGFNEADFLIGVRPNVKAMLDAMDKATSTSRGKNVKVVITGDDRKPGEIDAFNFCAAARILSEWRLLRQVPEGHKRYAISMKMGHKDVVQNIGKIEESAHAWINNHLAQQQKGSPIINSPTLRDLLQHEIDQNHHPNLPTLKEVSGAMGVLWLRRQIEFQMTAFQKLLEIPQNFPTSAEAFSSAYSQVYSKYHGNAMKKIFNYSLGKAPEIHEVYNCMNPSRLREVRQSLEDEDLDAIDDDMLKERITSEMEKDAREQISSFLEEVEPLLEDLELLIDECNMNDPKRV